MPETLAVRSLRHRLASLLTMLALPGVTVAVLSGCSRADRTTAELNAMSEQAAASPLRVAVTPDEQTTVREAEAALHEWLDASRERDGLADSMPVATHVLASGCGEQGSYFPSPLLARWTLAGSQLRGDTVVVRARVTTVAEQDIDRRASDRFVARQRVRTDVLEWDVIPSDDGWMVCNGIRFGYRGTDSLTRWMPDGASHASARALADSIRKANP